MLVKVADTRDRLHDVSGVIHYDHTSRTEAGTHFAERVKIHQNRVTDLAWQKRNGRAARNNRFQVFPAATNAAAMLFDELLHRNRHRFFNVARLVHVTGNTEDLCAFVVVTAKA